MIRLLLMAAGLTALLLFVLRPACPPETASHQPIVPVAHRTQQHVPLIEDGMARRPALARRNLFAFVDAPPARTRPSILPVVPIVRELVPQPAPAPKQEVPREPEFPLRYIGRFGPAQNPIAVFAGRGDVVNARIGDVIAGQFQLTGVGIESVEIASGSGTIRRVSIQP